MSPKILCGETDDQLPLHKRRCFGYLFAKPRSLSSVSPKHDRRFSIFASKDEIAVETPAPPPIDRPAKIVKDRSSPLTCKLQPRNTTPMATNSINFDTFAPDEPLKLPNDRVKQLKHHANTQYTKAIKALNKKSVETNTYRYQLDAARPKEQSSDLYDFFRDRQRSNAAKIRQLQPRNIKPYGNVTNMHWPASNVEIKNNVVYPQEDQGKVTTAKSEHDWSTSTQQREYCTIQLKSEEPNKSPELEKCNTVISEIKKINQDFADKSSMLTVGSIDEKKLIEKSEKLVNEVKGGNLSDDLRKCNRLIAQNKELNGNFISKHICVQRTKRDDKQTLKEMNNFAEEAKQKMFDVYPARPKPILLYYTESPFGGNKVLCSKLNRNSSESPDDTAIVRYRTLTKTRSTPVKVTVGPKFKLQSGRSDSELPLNPGSNEKYTVPWPSYAERVKNSRNFARKKNPYKLLQDEAAQLSTNFNLQQINTNQSEASQDKRRVVARDFSTTSMDTGLSNHNFSSDVRCKSDDALMVSPPNLQPVTSERNWMSLWNKSNGALRADDIGPKKNFVRKRTPDYERREYCTNTKRGVLGPEGTVMVKLPRLPKIKIPEPVKICPQDKSDCPDRADGSIKVKPRKLPKMTPSNCPPATKPCMHEGRPLKPPTPRKVTRTRILCPQPSTICAPRADAGLKIVEKQLPPICPSDCPPIEEPVMYTPPLPRLIPKQVPPQPPCKKPPCVGLECCPPRADAGLTVKRKPLPPVEPPDCPRKCPTKMKPGKPLRKLRKLHIPARMKSCESVCVGKECCPPRADKDYTVTKKRLKTLILCEKHNNLSAKEFNAAVKLSEKIRASTKRHYSTDSKCNMCCYSDKSVQPEIGDDAEAHFYDNFRPMTVAESAIHEEDDAEFTMIKKRIGPRSDTLLERGRLVKISFMSFAQDSKQLSTQACPCPFSCRFRCYSDSKKDDDDEPKAIKGEPCPCIDSKPFNAPQPKLRRLPKAPFEDRPPWECTKGHECNYGIPRADKDEDLYVRKSLPTLKAKQCPCIDKQQYSGKQPELKRLPKAPFDDRPDWACKDHCLKLCNEGIPRSDKEDDLHLQRKKLPTLEAKPCPCIDKNQYSDKQPKLRRLPKAPFDDRPEWACKDHCLKLCNEGIPRSDKEEDLHLERKALPTLVAKSCPCIDKNQYREQQPELKRLPKAPFDDRPEWACKDYCKKLCNEGIPRSDTEKELHLDRKTLPALVSKPCPCIDKHQYSGKQPQLRRLPKAPFDDRPVWSCKDYCKKLCNEGIPRSDQEEDLYLERKTLPTLVAKPCPCIDKNQYREQQPQLKRLPKAPFDDRPEWTCKDYCKKLCNEGIPRSDTEKELHLDRKTLPALESKPCPCVDKHQYSEKQPKLRRLPKAPFDDRPVWSCKDYCKKLCNEGIPRSDQVEDLHLERKKLPLLVAKPCPCIDKHQYREKQPELKRLPKAPFDDRPEWSCKDFCKKLCNEGIPRSDTDKDLNLERKSLPVLTAKHCPCVDKHQYSDKQPKLKRLPKAPFDDRPEWACKDHCMKLCNEGIPRSDKEEDLHLERKTLPYLEPKNCPCAEKQQYNIPQPTLKRLPKAPFEDRPPWKCKDDEKCPEKHRADNIAGYDVKRKKLPPIMSRSSKKFSTLSDSFLYKQNFTAFNRVAYVSTSVPLLQDDNKKEEKECKKMPRKQKGKSCVTFKVSPCKPRARMACIVESIKKDCTKQKSPYPSFSECKDEDQFPPITECGVRQKHLQPRWPIIDQIETQKPPPPHQGKIDPSREEDCVIEKLHMKREGGTKTCSTFDLPEKTMRSKEIMKEAMAQQPPPTDSEYSKPTGDGVCPVVDLTTCGKTELSYKPKGEKPRPSMICGKSEPVGEEKPKEEDECEEDKPKRCEDIKEEPEECEEKSKPKDCPPPKKKAKRAKTKEVPGCPPPKVEKCEENPQEKKAPKKGKTPKKSKPSKKSKASKESKEACSKSKKAEKKTPADICASRVAKPQPTPIAASRSAPKLCSGAAPPPPTNAPAVCPEKSFFQRIIDFFKARPNCPPPDQWKKDKLRKEAEKAAAAVGMELCEKKPKKTCVKSGKLAIKDCRKVSIKGKKKAGGTKVKAPPCEKPAKKKKKCKPISEDASEDKCKEKLSEDKCKPAKKITKKAAKGPCKSPEEDEEPCEEKPPKPCKQAPSGGKKCTLGPQAFCKPKARQSCKEIVKRPPPCTAVEPPYPSYSECKQDFPKLARTECTEQTRLKNKTQIKNDYEMQSDGGKGGCGKSYSTWAAQRRHFSSNSNKGKPGDPFALFNITEESINGMENNELALRILSVVKEGMSKMDLTTHLNARETYYGIFKELETLCEQELERNENELAIKPFRSDTIFAKSTKSDRTPLDSNAFLDLEQTMMVEAIKTFCRSIFSIPELSTKSYEESERIKTEKLQKQLDEILDNYKAQ